MNNSKLIKLIEESLRKFCLEFLQSPYLCYTEHGLHAMFYHKLANAIPQDQIYIKFYNQKVCIIQKEYRTFSNLGKTKRQHWDIAILDKEALTSEKPDPEYDYLPLLSVVEFGLNEKEDHLLDDIARLSHIEANITGKRFVLHLYRISEKFSSRDFSPRSRQMITAEKIQVELAQIRNVNVYFAIANMAANKKSLYCISKQGINPIKIKN